MINEVAIFIFFAVLGVYYLAFYLGRRSATKEIKVEVSLDKDLQKEII